MIKKNNSRKETSTSLEKFKAEELKNINLCSIHSMIEDFVATDKISLLSDKASSHALEEKKYNEFLTNMILQSVDGETKIPLNIKKENIQFASYSTQKSYRNRFKKRSVILDFLGKLLGKCAFVNIEMQRLKFGSTLFRARLHDAFILINNINENDKFNEIPRNYIIFICEHDPFYNKHKKSDFSKIRKIYHIVNVIAETGDTVDNGLEVIYLNLAAPEDDTPLGKLIHDLKCVNPDEMYYEVLANELRYYKENEEGVKALHKMWYSSIRTIESKNKVIRKQREELAKANDTSAKFASASSNLIHKLSEKGMATDEIANISGLTIQEIQDILEPKAKKLTTKN